MKDDMKLVHDLGISKELGEHSQIEARVADSGNNSDFKYTIYVHPSENDQLVYFQIYDNIDIFDAKKIARISMLNPEYIHCNDCSKEEWILSDDEKKTLIPIIKNNWENILFDFKDNRWSFEDEFVWVPMPDYTKLPTK